MYIKRYIEHQIAHDLPRGKIVIIFGPRQVGKTTLVKQFLTKQTHYYNCDLDDARENFGKHNLEHLTTLVAPYDRIILDEAQRVPGIGLTLKILIDAFPHKQFLVTGSSAFGLANTVEEPLTGRFLDHTLFPIAEHELAAHVDPVALSEGLELRLRFGSYPAVLLEQSLEEKELLIKKLTRNYLFKDILAIGITRRPELLEKIVRAIGLQLGHEVSLQEVAQTTGTDKHTVARYLELLEKTYVLFSLPPYRTNLRRSISAYKKYYFYDIGIRNAMIGNMNPLHLRADVGALWENYCIVERMKHNSAESPLAPNYFFWRSYEGQELDLIEERNGAHHGFEFKYTGGKISASVRKFFLDDLKGSSLELITRENVGEFIRPAR